MIILKWVEITKLLLIVMIVLAFKDGEVYRCDINMLFLPQLMSLLHKKNYIRLHDQWPKTEVNCVSNPDPNPYGSRQHTCLRLYWDHSPNPIHSSDLSGACVAVDVGEGGCSLISVWKFLKDLSHGGEAGHQHVATWW
jgi:hypothetical protein